MGWQDRAYNRDDNGGIPPVVFAWPKLSRLTAGLIGANLLLFILQAATSGLVTQHGILTLHGGMAYLQPWRFVTYQYLHGGAWHFALNMIGLYFFMPTLEMFWGWRKALAFYTLGGIAAGLTYCLLAFLAPQYAGPGLVGASGSVLALLGAVALFSPDRQLILLVFPVPIRLAAALLGGIYLLSRLADRNPSDAAHLGGLAFGFFAPYLAGPMFARLMHDRREAAERRAADRVKDEESTIDAILQKVHDSGMNSLTARERSTLKKATERQRISDARRAGRRV